MGESGESGVEGVKPLEVRCLDGRELCVAFRPSIEDPDCRADYMERMLLARILDDVAH